MKLSLVLIIYRSKSTIAEEAAKFCASVLDEKSILSIKLESDFDKNSIEDTIRNPCNGIDSKFIIFKLIFFNK